jgi:sugar phosphate isomerase/epimerase
LIPSASGATTEVASERNRLLGAFARIYRRDSADALAEAFVADQLVQVQLNLSALGIPTIPTAQALADLDTTAIEAAFTSRERVIWGVSATYNTAHPDPHVREETTTKAAYFIASLGALQPIAATLCTGTRDPDNMWRPHPDNTMEAAWIDMRRALDELIPAARHAGVLLAVEPEPGNVVIGTAEAKRLVAELGVDAEQIGFILDPANLVSASPPQQHERLLSEAFQELGTKTICVHAKDIQPWVRTLKGGQGVDYDLVGRLYHALPNQVPFIIQDATEDELPQVRDWLVRRLNATAPQ